MGRRRRPTQRVTEYYTSIQYAICHGPVEKLISIRANDKIVGNCAELRGPIIDINQSELFGGIKREGGLRGRLAWQDGSSEQLLDSYVASKKGKLPTQLPGYRGIATAFFTEWPGSGVRGFYWSANQPIIPPTHFRVTRIDRSWRSDIAAIPGDIDVARYAICIAIDVSLSMDIGGRLGRAKSAVVALLNDLKSNSQSSSFDIRIVAWSGISNAQQRRNCSQADYDFLISFVNGLTTSSATVFSNAVVGLDSFYDGASGKCRLFIFLTDGEPNDPNDATDAAEILQATGATAYAFNLDLTNTAQTAKMDNTAADGVPVISSSSNPRYLANIFKVAVTQQVDMNPAHMIRECLVNSIWGLGLPDSALDLDMFEAAAETLYLESFGLSMIWTQQSQIQEFVGEILSHIQATLYVNPMNGKLSLKLIRDDYDAASLDILNSSNSTVTSFKRRSPAEVTNEISVSWTNPASENSEVVTLQSLGSIVANNGEIVSDNRNYYGVRRASLAMELCGRDLAASTAPLSTAEVEADRSFSGKVPGDVVKLTDSENGAFELIMRVLKVDYGRPGASKVQLTLSEDVFSYARPRLIAPPVSEGEGNQSQLPTPPTSIEFITLNYFLNLNSSEGIDNLVDPETQVAFFVGTDNSDSFDMAVLQEITQPTGGTVYENTGDFDLIGRASLTAGLVPEAISESPLPSPVAGVSPAVGAFVVFGPDGIPEENHELALITGINGTTGHWIIRRSILDTTPREWPVGTPVRYFYQTSRMLNPEVSVSGISDNYRFLPRTSLGVLQESSSPVAAYTPSDRLHAPARPANVVVAGSAFGVVPAAGLATVSVSWANRNRLIEDAVLLAWNEASVTPEVGQTTTVRLVDNATNVTIIEYAGLTGTTHSFPATDLGSAFVVRVEVFSVRDGLTSIQGHSVLLDQTPLLAPGDLAFEVL